MTRTLTTALVAATIAFASLPARAADEANVQEARTLFKEGVGLFERGDFEHARVKFVAANALVKSADILWNLALAEAKSGRAPEALNHFRAYVHEPKARAQDVREAQTKWIPTLQPSTGELDVDGPSGTAVTVDGAAVGMLPLVDPLAVTAGSHHVDGRLGAETIARDVSVGVGQAIRVHLAPPAPPPSPVAAAPVASEPLPVSSAPASAAPPPASADVAQSTSSSSVAPLRIGVTVGLGVLAVGALGTGIYFAAQSSSEANDASRISSGLKGNACVNPSTPGCASLSQALTSENHDHNAAIGLYVGAGVLAAGALATWFFWPSSSEARSVALPYFGPGVAGMQWATRF